MLWPPDRAGGPLEKTVSQGKCLTTVSQKYTPCSLTQSVVTHNILPLLVWGILGWREVEPVPLQPPLPSLRRESPVLRRKKTLV